MESIRVGLTWCDCTNFTVQEYTKNLMVYNLPLGFPGSSIFAIEKHTKVNVDIKERNSILWR